MTDQNAKVINSLNNIVKEYIDFLERLESTTTDPVVAKKIREFLKKQKVWD
jgi:hypothetical protein